MNVTKIVQTIHRARDECKKNPENAARILGSALLDLNNVTCGDNWVCEKCLGQMEPKDTYFDDTHSEMTIEMYCEYCGDKEDFVYVLNFKK